MDDLGVGTFPENKNKINLTWGIENKVLITPIVGFHQMYH